MAASCVAYHFTMPPASSSAADEHSAAVDKAAALATDLAATLPLAAAALSAKRAQLAEATAAMEVLQQGATPLHPPDRR